MLSRLFDILGWNLRTIIFLLITLGWWSEFIWAPSSKRDRSVVKEAEKRSFYFIGLAIPVSILTGIALRVIGIGNFSVDHLTWLQWLSVVVYLIGLTIRSWSLRLLGKYFSRNVEVESEQDLVGSGPYRILRHPSYLGLFLLTLGVLLFIANLIGIVIVFPVMLIALSYRMKIEEQMMLDNVGKEYERWRRKRYKIIPYIY